MEFHSFILLKAHSEYESKSSCQPVANGHVGFKQSLIVSLIYII